MKRKTFCIITGVLTFGAMLPAEIASVEEAVAIIQKIAPEGAGSTEAAASWQSLVKLNEEAIVPLLKSMDHSGPVAKNWIRSAVEVIFSRITKESPAKLPLADIEAFLHDQKHPSQARKLAFDLIASVDAAKATELKPKFLNDPSPELRLGAVEVLMGEGQALIDQGKTAEATTVLQSALNSARDPAQIKEIAKQLKEKLNQTLDLPTHFGFLMQWQMAGPFDNTGRSGFNTVFGPEKAPSIDLNATFPGKVMDVKWRPYSTTDDYGMVDFNQPYNPLKEVTGYAYTTFESASDQEAELRLGCKNAWKIWWNGAFVFGRDEYHRGMRIDQYRLPIQLKKGSNTILVKVCQDEQEKDWTKEWQFQIRVCDSSGTAILSTDRKPTR